MSQSAHGFRHTKQSKIVLFLSALVAAYWYIGKMMDVYHTKFVGVVFEILWLPMIILLFALPIASLGFFVKDKLNLRSFYLYSLLIGIAGILITVLM
jgi:hypothetical protein